MKKALIAGWFSFEHGHATAGDLLALDVTCEWMQQAGYSYDIAYDPPFEGGVNWRVISPDQYSHVIFVCGPFEQGAYEAEFLSRFSACRLIGLNLSMLEDMHKWKPFDLLLERNSSEEVRPDMVFLSNEPKVPVVGVCLVEPYPGALDAVANEAINRLIAKRPMAIVHIDTRLDKNGTYLRSKAEVESLIANVDVLLTTRLHGAVMAIKNGVPVVPIDPEAGGAKIVLQMKKIGWPFVFQADALDDKKLLDAYDYCLTEAARQKARDCYIHATQLLDKTRLEFIHEMTTINRLEANYRSRIESARTEDWVLEKLRSQKGKEKLTVLAKLSRKARSFTKRVAYWSLPVPIYNRLVSTKR